MKEYYMCSMLNWAGPRDKMRTISGDTRVRNICFLIINVHYSTCNYRYKPAVHVSSVSHHNCNRNQEGVGDYAGCLWVRGGSTHRHALTQKCVSIPSLTNVWMFSQTLTFGAIESIQSPQSSYFKNEGRNQNAQEFFRGGCGYFNIPPVVHIERSQLLFEYALFSHPSMQLWPLPDFICLSLIVYWFTPL